MQTRYFFYVILPQYNEAINFLFNQQHIDEFSMNFVFFFQFIVVCLFFVSWWKSRNLEMSVCWDLVNRIALLRASSRERGWLNRSDYIRPHQLIRLRLRSRPARRPALKFVFSGKVPIFFFFFHVHPNFHSFPFVAFVFCVFTSRLRRATQRASEMSFRCFFAHENLDRFVFNWQSDLFDQMNCALCIAPVSIIEIHLVRYRRNRELKPNIKFFISLRLETWVINQRRKYPCQEFHLKNNFVLIIIKIVGLFFRYFFWTWNRCFNFSNIRKHDYEWFLEQVTWSKLA